MLGDVTEDGRERPETKLGVSRDGDVVFAAFERREAHVAARLSRYAVAENAEGLGKLGARNVARQLHAEMTSS